jgi:hypothetical protein
VIELADDALAGWAGEVLPGATVSLDRDIDADVVLDLVEVRDLGRRPAQLALRYRVSAGGTDVRERHRRLGELLLAAMAAPGYEVDLAPDPAAPRPSFVLVVPLRTEAPAPPPPALGPHVPIADAFVELPLLGLATRSDHRGRFTFAAVPSESVQQLVVHAKARTFPFSVDSPDVELRLDLLPKG